MGLSKLGMTSEPKRINPPSGRRINTANLITVNSVMERIDSTDPRTLMTLSATQMTAKEIILPVPVPAPAIK